MLVLLYEYPHIFTRRIYKAFFATCFALCISHTHVSFMLKLQTEIKEMLKASSGFSGFFEMCLV